LNGRFSDIRKSDDLGTVDGPVKMLKPLIVLGVKQPAFQTSFGDAVNLVGFKSITTGA